MIGIYEDSFGEFIEEHLGDYKVTSTNIVCKCPWCDYHKKNSSRDHLYIALDKPIFNCFRAGCGKSGTVKGFIKQISGTYIRDKYIDEDMMKKLHHNKSISFKKSELDLHTRFKLPEIRHGDFPEKESYLSQRLQYAQYELKNIKGLVFDVNLFLDENKLHSKLSPSDKKMISFLQNNFIGFMTENHSMIVFRNIDIDSDFRYYKLNLQKSDMLDYYKISHDIKDSNLIVIGEGIFDIFNDHIFDYIGYKDKAFGYYCALNSRFESLIKSIAFYDNIYNPSVKILSDKNVKVGYYKRMKKNLRNICSNIEVFYNVYGDDFGDTFCSPERIVL